MPTMIATVLAASTVQAIGTVIAVIAVLGVIVYALFNIRAGREEVGSEVELAANLRPYLDDDELETTKLDRTLTVGLLGLVLVGVGLPAYWLAEPGRQDGADEYYENIFISRGENEYTEGAGCNACHGPDGVGGVTDYTILDDAGNFVAQVQWKAPALNTVMLRYSEEEVRYVLDYGRPYSPMQAWGLPGGGSKTTQQIDNIIAYLDSITLSAEDARAQVETELREELGLAEGAEIDYDDLATGEALFNLGGDSGSFAGGAYSCARCHTRGWSIIDDDAQPEGVDLSEYVDYEPGAGAYGPPLRNVVPRQFSDLTELVEFLMVGTQRGEPYGNGAMGDGGMPGFGDNPNTEDPTDDGMLSLEQIEAIARYVMSLEISDDEVSQLSDDELPDDPEDDAADAGEEG